MAQAEVVLDKDHFNCSVCLDVLKNPVTIPCGHSYCADCIESYWDQDDYLGVFACPQCRQNFAPRPLLARNTMLADVVERFRKTELDEAATASCQTFAEAADVECDVCTVRRSKAVRSCLVCLASYCELHVQPHYESAAFKKHKLVPASKVLQETICSRHDKLLEVYCRTDGLCICCLCLTDEHKGHDTVLADAEIQEKQRQIGAMQQSAKMKIQQREKEAQELRQASFYLTRSARAAAENSDAVFSELIRSIELKRFEVRELVKAQEKRAISQAELLLEKMGKEIAELKTSEAELNKLAAVEDNIQFLQGCQSLQAPPVLSALPAVAAEPSLTFDPAMTALSDFKRLLQEVCQDGFVSFYERVRDITIVEDTPAADLQTSLPAEHQAAAAAAAVTPPAGLDQIPVNQLNPFLAARPGAGKAFSLGGKLSSGSRHRHQQGRRFLTRRK